MGYLHSVIRLKQRVIKNVVAVVMIKTFVAIMLLICCSVLSVNAELVYRIIEVVDENGNIEWIPVLVDDNDWKK